MRSAIVWSVVFGVSSVLGVAQDWPHFRGPDHSGKSSVTGLLKGKPFGFEVDWIRDLGPGYSSVSVTGNKGVTMYCTDQSDILLGFDADTGETLWQFELGPVYEGHSGSHGGPSSTPTFYEDRVFALDTHGRFVAVDWSSGRLLWDHHLGKDIEARVPYYGFSTAPLVVGNKVVLMTGEKSGRALTAFSQETGEPLWYAGDDTTTYQSPCLWRRDGKQETILALTDHYLMEIDPEDGEIRWQHEHTITDNESFAPPVVMGPHRFLIMHRFMMAAVEISWDEQGSTMKELWRSERYPQTYSIPMFHEDHLYFFRGQFLTCLEADTGARVWRSRPPGGQTLMLTDGHLIILSKRGDLVAVEATPEGYREAARLPVFKSLSFSSASFANGYFYVRNEEQMARIKVTDQIGLKREEAPELHGAFGQFVAGLKDVADKNKAIDAYMKKNKQFPVIEDDGWVHFLYRGEVEDIALALGFDEEIPLSRVEGTDLYYHSKKLDLDGHWEYHFSSYGEPRLDPLNPWVIGKEPRIRNELRMPNWSVPAYLGEPTGDRGRLDTLEISSTFLERDMQVSVYLPAEYERSDARYPVLFVMDGDLARDVAHMDVCLDHLNGTSNAPVMAVFLAPQRAETLGDQRENYARFLVEELAPQLDRNYRTLSRASSRCIMGPLVAATSATYVALKYPEVFGRLAIQSFLFLSLEEDIKQSCAGKDLSQFGVFADISRHDFKRSDLDAAANTGELIDALKARNAHVVTQSSSGAPGWTSWRAQWDDIFRWFAPLDPQPQK